MAQEIVRIGVVGTGFGAFHVEVLQDLPGVQVAAICSAQQERAEAVAERFGIPFATDDYHAVLDHVDAVIIATPPAFHATMTLDAIAAGKHILCEKPMAATLDEAIAMRDAANRSGTVAMINFHQRFMAHWSRTAKLIHDGIIGNLVMADIRITMNPVDYLAAPGWSDTKAGWFSHAAQSGGLLGSSVGPHLIDLMQWIGGPISEVSARTIVSRPTITLPDGSEVRGIDAEDGFAILARYESGAILTLRGAPVVDSSNDWDMELFGDDGTLIIDARELLLSKPGDKEPAPIEQPTQVNPRTGIASLFVDAIHAGGVSPHPNFDDGVAAQAVLEATLQAAQSGEWVNVERS
jgi:predicted dehydrogenase